MSTGSSKERREKNVSIHTIHCTVHPVEGLTLFLGKRKDFLFNVKILPNIEIFKTFFNHPKVRKDHLRREKDMYKHDMNMSKP